MIYSIVPFPVTLSDRLSRFQGHGVIIDALDILCGQLTSDLFATAKFLFKSVQRFRSCSESNQLFLSRLATAYDSAFMAACCNWYREVGLGSFFLST